MQVSCSLDASNVLCDPARGVAQRRRKRRRKVYSELTQEEEGLFKADAVNEEDPERDRATLDHRDTTRRETHPYLSMLLYPRVK